ncbi:MAG: AAA family ATPase [Gemmatimonadales bacterium]|nr:AAA family ATPase [Gemmatimonadales bacterium]NIN10841.1 AAA family ATPase [Gemmatimonadales bacterium]NIN49484.1 AAA family ATPase [Gemmatimonadales bacterium]NIP06948.1 AAA family ATPase [Gemmatimonadales bacterium]NIR01624.1 AAA family ATPase [Gemmatimonadales bacterium]
MISCRTLGPVEVTIDGGAPPPELLWRKNLALLVYLARSPKRTRTRDHLIGLLWADKPESSARHSLREAIRVLRRIVGEEQLQTEHGQVRLANDAVRLDTDEFLSLESAGDWSKAASLIGGEFLEGFSVPDASTFEDWLAAERLAWRRRAASAFVQQAEEFLRRGSIREAADAALRALDLEASSDAGIRAAMKALALAGDRAGALTSYEEFLTRLEQLGTAPDPETKELAQRVRREREWRLPDEVPVDAARGAESRRAPLVGREAELERLLRVFQDCVQQRRAAACVIEGDSGLGKSRLAEELLGRARLDGAAAATVRAVEADLQAPLSGILGFARGGLLEAPGLAAAAPPALAAFAAEVPEWADRFGRGRATPSPLTGALSEALRAITEEQPVLLLADNAQWLDRDSLLALLAAARDLAESSLLLVFTTQPEPSRPELDDLRSRIGRDTAGTTVVLQPLATAALRQLARWAVPTYTDAEVDRLARRLAVDSAGVPLLAVELLHAVALGLDLGTITGAWPEPFKTLDQTLPGELPDAVVAAIRVGFRRLTGKAQQVLAAAAVLGDRVEVGRLERCTGQSGDRLFSALDELEWQRWLTADPRGYSFVARIVRDVVERDMLTAGQRQRILDADLG